MNKWLEKYSNGDIVQQNYNDVSVSLPEGFVGMGYNTKGRNYSPAWGGQFEEGGVTSPQICYDPKTGKVVPCKPGAHKTWIFTENPAITASQFELNMNKTTRENAIKDNEFTKEAQDLKNYLIKNQPGEDIEIYPTYKSDKNDRVTTTNRGKTLNEILRGSDAKTRLAFMAHHGSNLFGSPAGNLGKKLQATTYDNCYLGSCYSGDIAASDEFKGLSNFNFRPGYVEYNSPDGKEGLPWFGVNPNKNSQTGEAGVNNAFFNTTNDIDTLNNLYKQERSVDDKMMDLYRKNNNSNSKIPIDDKRNPFYKDHKSLSAQLENLESKQRTAQKIFVGNPKKGREYDILNPTNGPHIGTGTRWNTLFLSDNEFDDTPMNNTQNRLRYEEGGALTKAQGGVSTPQAQKSKTLRPIVINSKLNRAEKDSAILYNMGITAQKQYKLNPNITTKQLSDIYDTPETNAAYVRLSKLNKKFPDKKQMGKPVPITDYNGMRNPEFIPFGFTKPVGTSKPKPEFSLKKKVTKAELLKSDRTAFNPQITQLQNQSINLPTTIQQRFPKGDYNYIFGPANSVIGRNYNGQFYSEDMPNQRGGVNQPDLDLLNNPEALKKYVQNKGLKFAMGGSLPGSVGFTYARTNNPAPSNGPYAKKTKASAQTGETIHPTNLHPINLHLPKYKKPKPFFTGYGFSQNPVNNVNVYGVGAYGTGNINDRLNLSGNVNSASVFYPGGQKMFMDPRFEVWMKYKFNNGGSMSYYQNGLDWKPKNISKNGGWLNKFDEGGEISPNCDTNALYHPITNPCGYKLKLTPGLLGNTTQQTTQPYNSSNFREQPLANSNSYIQQQIQQKINNTKRVEDNYLKNKILNQPQLKQAKRETPYERERRTALNSSYVGSNQYAALDDDGNITNRIPGIDITGKVYDSKAVRQERMKPLIAAGAIAAGATALPAVVSAATPYVAATSAALNAPLLGTLGAEYGSAALTTNNLINAYFAYEGIKNIPKVVDDWKEVGKSPTLDNVGNATSSTLLSALGILPFTSGVIKGIPSVIQDFNQAGKYLTEQTPLRNASKLNPYALTDDILFNKEGVVNRQIFGDDAYNQFLEYGPTTRPGVSEIDQLLEFARAPKSGVISASGERFQVSNTMEDGVFKYPYFQEGNLWYTGQQRSNLAKELGKERIITTPKDEWFRPAGEATVMRGDEEVSKGLIDSYSKGRRVLMPGTKYAKPSKYSVFEPHWWKGYKEVPKPATASSAVENVKPTFKSEIDWSKWNKEIPKNKALMDEYSAIEQTSKADGSWMKNPDGSPFQGTPEQFVQQNSANFKKAFPEGFTNTFRGSGVHNPELINNKNFKSVFTGDENLARAYGNAYNNKNYQNYFNPNIPTGEELLLKNHLFKDLEAAKLDPKNRALIKAYSQSEDAGIYNLYSKNTRKNLKIDAKGADWKKLPQQDNLPYLASNDDVAKYIDNNNLDQAFIKDVHDGILGDILIAAHKKRNYLKSAIGNNGMFDMTNPNIYKAILPIGLGLGAASQLDQKREGGIIKDDMGQWNHPGEITEIGSPYITMQGVPYDVLGISDTGDTKLMKPGKNYKFKGKKVTEYPMAKNGVRQEQKGLQNLDDLLNFTNYNKPQPGGWLEAYK